MIVSDKMSSDSFLFSSSSAQLQHHGQCFVTGHTWSQQQGRESQGAAVSAHTSGVCLPRLCHVQAQGSQPAAPVGSTMPAPSPCRDLASARSQSRVLSWPAHPAWHRSRRALLAWLLHCSQELQASQRWTEPCWQRGAGARAPAGPGRGSSTSGPCRAHGGQCPCQAAR